MKRKRLLSLLLVLVMLATMLVGCGGNGASNPDSGTNSGTDSGTNQSDNSNAGTDEGDNLEVEAIDPNPGFVAAGTLAASPAVDKETVKVALWKNFSDIDGISSIVSSFCVSNLIVEPLTKMQSDGSVTPHLAKSWERMDDLTWRFYLREGVTFSNGQPFNADSAVETINVGMHAFRTYKYKNYYANSFPFTAEKVDDYTIDVTTSAPNAALPQLINRLGMWPCGASEDEDFVKNPIGTGQYVLDSWDLGYQVVLKSRPEGEYWGEESDIKTFIFDIIENEETRVAALEAGEYDVINGVPLDKAYEILQSNDTCMDLYTGESWTMSYIAWNGYSDEKFTSDPVFRAACEYAIDYKGINESLLHGLMTPATGPCPALDSLMGGWNEGAYPEYNPEKCQELLDQCGYNGEELIFYYSSSQFASDLAVCEALVSMLNAAGINIKFEQIDSSAWQEYMRTGGFALSANSINGPSHGFTDFYYTTPRNSAGWDYEDCNALVDSLYAPGVTSEDYAAISEEILETYWKYHPYLWASESINYHACNPNLKGFTFNPQNILDFTGVYWE